MEELFFTPTNTEAGFQTAPRETLTNCSFPFTTEAWRDSLLTRGKDCPSRENSTVFLPSPSSTEDCCFMWEEERLLE